jgi:hypothetical protein
MNSRIYDEYREAELKNWPGVSVSEVRRGSKADRVYLAYNGKSRFVSFPHSPSDSRTGPRNHVQDVRRVLRELGAQRVS